MEALVSSAQPTDRELVDAARRGDGRAFDEIVARYDRYVFKLAHGFARSREDALDLSQIVFLRVYRRLGSFRGDSSLKTWLTRVAYNEGVSWLRANRRHVEGHESAEVLEVLPDDEEAAETRLDRRRRLESVRSALTGLGDRYREALWLRYFQGFSVREVADSLGCTEGTAKNALFRGLRALKKEIHDA